MSTNEKEKKFTYLVSDSFEKTDDKCNFEVAFRRWLVREIEAERITVSEVIDRFNFNPGSAPFLIKKWRSMYAGEMLVDLPAMTEKEKQKLESLQKQIKAMEKQLEDAQMRNIALNTLIDVAEEKLKINIRKKPGAKQ